MADDRIYMKCNICGSMLYLGKQFAYGPFFWENYALEKDSNAPSLEDQLNAFYEAHYHPESHTCKWNGNFSIVYEIDDYVPGLHRTIDCDDCKGIAPFCEKGKEDAEKTD